MTQRREAATAHTTSQEAPGHLEVAVPAVPNRGDMSVRDLLVAGGLRAFTPEQMFGQSSRLNLDAEVVPLHDFSQPNAPVTAYRVRIQGEHIAPRLIGERRSTRAEAEADLAKLVHA